MLARLAGWLGKRTSSVHIQGQPAARPLGWLVRARARSRRCAGVSGATGNLEPESGCAGGSARAAEMSVGLGEAEPSGWRWRACARVGAPSRLCARNRRQEEPSRGGERSAHCSSPAGRTARAPSQQVAWLPAVEPARLVFHSAQSGEPVKARGRADPSAAQ